DTLRIAPHFLRKYAHKYMKPAADFDQHAEQKLLGYHYPGNMRELQYSIERAVIMAEGAVLSTDDLIFSPIDQAPAAVPGNLVGTDRHNLVELERITIANVVEKHGGNISKAAKELGITRTALYRRLSKYDI